jgi:alkylation response protein AidB-like acyl-CoA dehydrogenase
MDRELERSAVIEGRRWQGMLADAGLAGITWPTAYGGQGLTTDHHRVFIEEAAPYDLGTRFFNVAFGMVGPTILQVGTEEQKAALIPAMLRGTTTWCQLFSEPGAGSDVASLQTRAVLDGDEWVVNGQKVWTSGAHRADQGALLARTDPGVPKHQGLTMFLVDMHQPGVTVRPLRQITGEASFNEVFFDDVRIPRADVLGPVGDGWKVAVAMLMNERMAIGSASGGNDITAGAFAHALAAAGRAGRADDPVIRQRLARVYSLERVLGFVRQRSRAAVQAGKAPGPEGSIGKLLSAWLAQETSALQGTLGGASAQAWLPETPDGDDAARSSMSPFFITIGGGTNEIQRNIIGERVLNLPREPQVDRDIPFRDLRLGTYTS